MRALASTLSLFAVMGSSMLAWGSGAELLPGGTRSVARGGAVHARPEDPHALLHNPAGLAFLSDSQVMLEFDIAVHRMCVDPYGYYGWGAYVIEGSGDTRMSEFGDPIALDDPNNPSVGATYATTPLAKVCNSAPPGVLPQFAWAGKVTDQWTIAAGFVAPTLFGGIQFGGEDGTVQTDYGSRPTPTRYTVIKQEVSYGLYPTLGTAFRFVPWLSAGATLQVLMVKAASTQVQATTAGTSPSGDNLVRATTQDFFIPSVTASVHARPIPALNLMAGFRWQDSLRGSGDVVVETNTYRRGLDSGGIPFVNDPVPLDGVTVQFPWQFDAGIRYAGRLPGAEENGDPMDTELWDVEVDFSYLFNERASTSSVALAGGGVFETRTADGKKGEIELTDLPTLQVDRHLKDVYAVRVGASVSVLPKKLAVLAGGFYESRGVDPAYADVDSFAFARYGAGAGVMWRIGAFDLRAAYSHIFSETLDVAPPPHQNLEDAVPGRPRTGFDKRVGGEIDPETGERPDGVVYTDPDAPKPANADGVAAKTQGAGSTTDFPARVINAGRYTAGFDVVSVGMVFHF